MRLLARVATVVAAAAVAMSAAPALAACLSDEEIERALGASVRSGAAIIDTRAMLDLPLCSGLTLAQQIQRIRAAAFPPAPAPAPIEDEPLPQPARPLTVAPRFVPPPERVDEDPAPVPRFVSRVAKPRPAASRAAPPRRRAAVGFYASCSPAIPAASIVTTTASPASSYRHRPTRPSRSQRGT